MTGETAADTLRRLRLHHAAGELVQGQAPIAALARQAGYRSIAAFTPAPSARATASRPRPIVAPDAWSPPSPAAHRDGDRHV
jgi:AraC family transcriptional regulator